MAERTPNYGMIKPAPPDFYNIADFNENSDIVDAALKALSDGVVLRTGATVMSGLLRFKLGAKTDTPLDIRPVNANGDALLITCGGLTVIGGGEFPQSFYATEELAGSAEHLVLGADSDIYFYAKGNTIANRIAIIFDTNGALRPSESNTRTLGTAAYPWSAAYATKYYGGWSGDAIGIDKGGTGATTAAAARAALGVMATGDTAVDAAKLGGQLPAYYRNASNIDAGTVPAARLPTIAVSKGGTGATTAAQAVANLGAVGKAGTFAEDNVMVFDAGGNAKNSGEKISDKAYKAKTQNLTLTASSWSGNQYTLSSSIVTSTNPPGDFGLAVGATQAQASAWADMAPALVSVTSGKIVIRADGVVPQINIPVQVEVRS